MTKNQKPKAKEQKSKAEDLIPKQLTLRSLQAAAADCKACDLWLRGTQTVFGEGRLRARIMFIGEQPGNEEDLSGKPFVGPAGRLLDAALQEAGIDRSQTYVTNVVKHFKWEPRGKRRIHKKPNAQEIAACHPWLKAEIVLIQPEIIVALGSHGGSGPAWATVSGNKAARRVHRILPCSLSDGHRPSIFDTESPG